MQVKTLRSNVTAPPLKSAQLQLVRKVTLVQPVRKVKKVTLVQPVRKVKKVTLVKKVAASLVKLLITATAPTQSLLLI